MLFPLTNPPRPAILCRLVSGLDHSTLQHGTAAPNTYTHLTPNYSTPNTYSHFIPNYSLPNTYSHLIPNYSTTLVATDVALLVCTLLPVTKPLTIDAPHPKLLHHAGRYGGGTLQIRRRPRGDVLLPEHELFGSAASHAHIHLGKHLPFRGGGLGFWGVGLRIRSSTAWTPMLNPWAARPGMQTGIAASIGHCSPGVGSSSSCPRPAAASPSPAPATWRMDFFLVIDSLRLVRYV